MMRTLDHLLLTAGSLSLSRRRLQQIDFIVASNANHPFCTANACVFFADGSYLEPLAIQDQVLCDEAVSAGNVFFLFDQQYRMHNGDDGFSALVVSKQAALRFAGGCLKDFLPSSASHRKGNLS
ncbi:VOC family protein [Hoeflea sp. WL0058]|uniref:VOC family protein n=1 Tax=Flavimaribacter sediminis TaxID=2865987 RepID=A0AAE3D0M6_9HYPH|nr:VOC family protein [Flavimaribacter sediminis]MBW8636921.1 VOC family protein [Flavimaribacter sediminis]